MEGKLSAENGFSVDEAQAILTELRSVQASLSNGEKEKSELLGSLARLKDELTRLQPSDGSSPDISTFSLPTEKLSTASQTDLSGEVSINFVKNLLSFKDSI